MSLLCKPLRCGNKRIKITGRTMRVLHTADWHLGKRLDQQDRSEEHRRFLDWLLQTLQEKQVDVLVVAGDIFDSGNPPNAALKQYYDFLWRARATGCQDIIITGGNHDAVATLNAPRELLRHLRVHVVGGVPEDIAQQVIVLQREQEEQAALVVCAVPFLRDRDIRLSTPGESAAEREQRIRLGIAQHYHNLVPLIAPYKAQGIPVMATGHLFAAGATASPDSEQEIHIGSLGQIGADQFPQEFDYIALGHLHRPQRVHKTNHIRYSGAPVPLSFSENEDRKMVLLIDFLPGQEPVVSELEVPRSRRLLRIKGELEAVKAQLAAIPVSDSDELPAWVEIQLQTPHYLYDLEEQLAVLTSGQAHIGQLFIRQLRSQAHRSMSAPAALSLRDLSPREVFIQKCDTQVPEEERAALLASFDEAIALFRQQDPEDKETNSAI
jgi:exonuclease SbcD